MATQLQRLTPTLLSAPRRLPSKKKKPELGRQPGALVPIKVWLWRIVCQDVAGNTGEGTLVLGPWAVGGLDEYTQQSIYLELPYSRIDDTTWEVSDTTPTPLNSV